MKIEFIKSATGIGYGYLTGAILDCTQAFGKEMIELGYAIELSAEIASDLPENLPMRKELLAAGIDTIAALKDIATPESFQSIKGIGQKSAKAIIEFIENL